MTKRVGLIANPASGTDIRRLVAHASVFGTDEKINILRRVLLALEAAGVRQVGYMPDAYRLVPRALEELELSLDVAPLEISVHGDVRDTTASAAALAEAGAGVIVSLGGDGTNRSIVLGSRDVPLVPISTGTNNVFPVMVEGTVAGLAAGALATGVVDAAEVAPRCKLIEIEIEEGRRELALIDAIVLERGFVASRAIWRTDTLREGVLARAAPDSIGLAAVGGLIQPVTPDENGGLHLVFGPGGCEVRAPIAPGLIQPVAVARWSRLPLGETVSVHGPALLALDGERELLLAEGAHAELRVERSGPPLVDLGRCLEAARRAGFLRDGS